MAVQPQSAKGAIPSKLWTKSLFRKMYAITVTVPIVNMPRPIELRNSPFAALRTASGFAPGHRHLDVREDLGILLPKEDMGRTSIDYKVLCAGGISVGDVEGTWFSRSLAHSCGFIPSAFVGRRTTRMAYRLVAYNCR